ncbi:MAG: pseudouridine synthase [Xanthomonadales bacterium]|nr:pseudouridine synthase [Xanthomonadales bacterium]
MNQTLKLRTDGRQERLHKVLATSGLGSRRKLEERILQGEVKLNGEAAELGSLVSPGDRVDLDGKTFVIRSATGRVGQVLMYHKPEGELTARTDPEGRPTVFESLPFLKGARWVAVGRLDFNTTGLLLFTTDGELANRLMHPAQELQREYVARVYVEDADELPAIQARLREEIELEDGPAQFQDVELIGHSGHNALFMVSLSEGRNREVRRMFAAIGLEVGRLKRTKYGPIELPKRLARGNYETLSPEEALSLAKSAGHDSSGTQLIAEPESLARKREREAGKRSKREVTPLRRPAAARSSDEFDRPRELVDRRSEAGRDRPGRRQDGRRRGPRQDDQRQGARPNGRDRRGAQGARPGGQRQNGQPARAGNGQGQGQGQPRPGRGRRSQAEFRGPMDYASGQHLSERSLSEADDNRGNRIDAGADLGGGTAYTPGQHQEWKPNWTGEHGQAQQDGNRIAPGNNQRRPGGGGKRRPGGGGGGRSQDGQRQGAQPRGDAQPGARPSGGKRRGPRNNRRERPAGPPRSEG